MADDAEFNFTSEYNPSRTSLDVDADLKSESTISSEQISESIVSSKQTLSEDAETCEDTKSRKDIKTDDQEQIQPNRASPEPSCSICLGSLKDKCFTDSCSHTFCFACLLEWSKVKAECPLCKMSFKSIMHNVHSNEDFDQYYVQQTSSFSALDSNTQDSSRRRERARTLNVALLRLNPVFSLGIEQQRITYAPHSVRNPSVVTRARNQIPRNMEFRRRVYQEHLWAKGSTSGPRLATSDFYRTSPACTHRLVPWLTRELHVLLNNEHRASFVLDFIMAIILRYDIKSEEFFLHTQSYLGKRTAHFVHEFYTFASSRYDIDEYDTYVEYDNSPPWYADFEDVITVSSGVSDNDDDISVETLPFLDHPVSTGFSTGFSPVPSSSSSSEHHKQKRVPKLSLKKNHESNSWDVCIPPISPTSSTSSSLIPNFDINSDHRTVQSVDNSIAVLVAAAELISANKTPSVILSSDDDREVEIVAEVKPKWMRTPEVIDLSSDSDRVKTPQPLEDLEPVSDGSFTIEHSDNETYPEINKSINADKIFSQNPIHESTETSSVDVVSDRSRNKRKHSKHSTDYRHKRHNRKESHSKSENQLKKKYSSDHYARWSSSSSSLSPVREKIFRPWSPELDHHCQDFYSSNKGRQKGILNREISDEKKIPDRCLTPVPCSSSSETENAYLSPNFSTSDSYGHVYKHRSHGLNHKKHKKSRRRHEKHKHKH